MKTIVKMLALVVVFVSLTWSCTKELPIPPDEPKTPTITKSVTPPTDHITLEVGQKGSFTFQWRVNGVCEKFEAKDNGEIFSTDCSGIYVNDTATVSHLLECYCYKVDNGENILLTKASQLITVDYATQDPDPTFNAWSNGTVARGGNDTIHWQGQYLATLSVNGSSLPLSGSVASGYLVTENIQHDTVYYFSYQGTNGKTGSFSVTTTVAVLPKTNMEKITGDKWSPYYATAKTHKNDPYVIYPLDEEYKNQYSWFYDNETGETFQNPLGVKIDEFLWRFESNETKLIWGGCNSIIDTLSTEKLAISYFLVAGTDTLFMRKSFRH